MIQQVYERISRIIKADFKNTFPGGQVILQDSTSKEVRLNKRGHFLCFQLDRRNINVVPFFESSFSGLCKVSDRIIVYPTEQALFIFIIELKTTNVTGSIQQVRASFELSKYICSSALRLLNYPIIPIEYRGIIFSSKVFKGNTKPKNLKYIEDLNSGLKYQHFQSGKVYDLDQLSY